MQGPTMSPTLESLGIRTLPIEDRLRIANDLWDSVENDSPKRELSDALKAELDRRIADDDANPDVAIPFDVFDAEMRRQFAS